MATHTIRRNPPNLNGPPSTGKSPEPWKNRADRDLARRMRLRLGQAAATAAGNAGRIAAALAAHAPEFTRAIATLRNSPQSRAEKLLRLRALADLVASAAASHAACRVGCAHCCHLPVAISRVEAELIAERTGHRAAPIERSRPLQERGPSQPCPFLADDRCSIYASRPIACRLHFNLDVDALLCHQLPGRTPPAPLLDVRNLHLLYALICEDAPVADIRDFFGSAGSAHNASR